MEFELQFLECASVNAEEKQQQTQRISGMLVTTVQAIAGIAQYNRPDAAGTPCSNRPSNIARTCVTPRRTTTASDTLTTATESSNHGILEPKTDCPARRSLVPGL